jgi:hypothetical protein
MKNICRVIIGGISALLITSGAWGSTIDFEDLVNGTKVTTQYSALGATFTDSHFAVVGGIYEGDPGNWDLDGTNGSHFLGFNGNPSYTQMITWDEDVFDLSLDVSRSNGSQSGDTFTVTGLLDGLVVDSQMITLAAINTWSSITLVGTFDEVQWGGAGTGFHPYGVDNIQFSAVPIPAAAWLFGSALAGLGWLRRKQTV